MVNILRNPIPGVMTTSAGLAAGLGVTPLPFINAATVIDEVIKRCGNGMQYTTFPNQITPLEKAKLTGAGYFVTGNIVPSAVRHGAGDLYIGFQVALNQTAVAASMQMLPNTGGGGVPSSEAIAVVPVVLQAADWVGTETFTLDTVLNVPEHTITDAEYLLNVYPRWDSTEDLATAQMRAYSDINRADIVSDNLIRWAAYDRKPGTTLYVDIEIIARAI